MDTSSTSPSPSSSSSSSLLQLRHRFAVRLLFVVAMASAYLCAVQAQQHQQHSHRRRRPLDQQHAVTAHPLNDQIAVANSWHVPNRVITATYAGNLDTGHVSQSNVVVNVLPHEQRVARYSADDLANAESLANTRTAAEYVTKAMEMRGTKHQLKAPQSSYIKYDVYANQEEKTIHMSAGGSGGGGGGSGIGSSSRQQGSRTSTLSASDFDDRDEGRDNGDSDSDDDDDGSSSDGFTTEPSSRYFISEQVTSHQHRPTAAPSTATTIIKPPRSKARPQQQQPTYHRQPQQQPTPAPTSGHVERHPAATTRSYEADYEYAGPRKPDYGSPYPMKSSAAGKDQQQHQHQHHQSEYDSYGSSYSGRNAEHSPPPPPPPSQQHQNYPHDSYHPLPQPTELPKSEMIKHIQHSVLRYMQELEAQGRFTSTTTTSTTTSPPPPPPPPAVEIKTYYRIPAHHSSSSSGTGSISTSAHEAINQYNFGMGRGKSTYPKHKPAATPSISSSLPADYYRTPASDVDDSYFPESYTTVSSGGGLEAYPATTMSSITYHQQHHASGDSTGEISTPHIDLTFRSKARPKPIDLAALDVGQSWSHDAEPPPSEKVYYRYPTSHASPSSSSSSSATKPLKPMHFSSQTYHDINSMTYAPAGGSKPATTYHHYGADGGGGGGYESLGADAEQTPVRFKDEAQTVVTYQEPASADELLNDVQQHYRSPIHIINGIPVANPYEFNVEQLKQMFGGHSDDIREHRGLHADHDTDTDGSSGAYTEGDTAPKESAGWQPSFSPEPSYTKPRGPKTHHRDRPSSTYHHNLPYESYTSSARYKEQKKLQQQHDQQLDPSVYDAYTGEEWHASDGISNYGHNGHRPADMYSSSTSASMHRSKKPKSNSSAASSASSSSSSASSSQSNGHKKRQKKRRPNNNSSNASNKGKDKTKHGKKSRSLETELRPPPAGILY